MQKKYLIPLALLFFVLLIGGGFFYFYSSNESATIRKETDNAYMTFNNGNYQNAVEDLRSLATTASKQDRGRVQLLLASALYARNEGGDVEEAVSILKKIIADYSISPMIRALALNNIARAVQDHDTSFYTSHFNDGPLRLLSSTSTDATQLGNAYYNILKLSDETYPNSYAEYSIAGYFSTLLANTELASTERIQDAKLMQQYVQEGDNLNDAHIYSTGTVLFGLLYRALAINSSGTILKNISLDAKEASYKKVLDYGTELENSGDQSVKANISQSALLQTRFWYATFLMKAYPGKRNNDIQTLLKPFAQNGVATNPYLNLIYLKNADDNSSIKRNALSLAKVSTEFRIFLVSTGVKVN